MQKNYLEGWKKPNPFRSKIVFFEGLDKTGKSTLCRRVRFDGGHTVMFFDRGFAGRWLFYVYNKELDFPMDDWTALEGVLISMKSLAVVHLVAPYEDLKIRHYRAGEKPPEIEIFKMQDTILSSRIRALSSVGVPILKVNTAAKSEDENVKTILMWAEIIPKEINSDEPKRFISAT